MTTSTWRCANGHTSWSPRRLEQCPHGKCGAPVQCVAGPMKPRDPAK